MSRTRKWERGHPYNTPPAEHRKQIQHSYRAWVREKMRKGYYLDISGRHWKKHMQWIS